MRPEIRWQSFERSCLPDALFGKRTDRRPSWQLADALSEGRGIALGYPDGSPRPEYDPPSLIAIEDDASAEVLSWIRTYAPSAFPLNQFARVILRSDWDKLSRDPLGLGSPQRGDAWASVVLGELLAQGDMELDTSSLPLSRYASCFSTAIARTAILHSSNDSSFEECARRLARVEESASFSERSVTVRALEPIWRVAYRAGDQSHEVHDVLRMVLEPLLNRNGEAVQRGLIETVLNPRGDLFSDSVESRVLAFQRIKDEVVSVNAVSAQANRVGELALASIAIAAFLVGRGTSHGFLISRLGPRWAKAFIWFGLMGGLCGPTYWEQPWSLVAKGIEKFLRARFDWCDSSGADLSWAEYLWTSSLSGATADIYAELPKSVPKALSIEILPGASCQLRLAADSGAGSRLVGASEGVDSNRVDYELRDTLNQLANLAIRARDLLVPRKQLSLQLDDSGTEPSKAPAARSKRRRL